MPAKLKLGTVESNIWKFTLLLITNKRAFMAILGVYYLSIEGVTENNLGLLMLVGSISSFLFEIPSGIMSDKFGHKKMLVITRFAMLASSLCYLFASNYVVLVLATVLLSFAFSCLSGSDKAFMYDTLKALGKEKEYSKIMGKASSIGFAVPIVFMTLPPCLIEYSYRMPFALSVIIDIIGLLAAVSLVNVEHEERRKNQKFDLKKVVKEGFSMGYLHYAMLASFTSGILATVHFYRAPMQEFSGADVAWFGIYFGIGRALISVMLYFNGWFKEKFTINSYQRFRIYIFTVLILLLGFCHSWQAIVAVFILLQVIQWGMLQVTNHFMMELLTESRNKATLMSIRGQMTQGFSVLSAVAMSSLLLKFNYSVAFLIIGIAFFILSGVLYLNIKKFKTKTEERGICSQ